MSADEMIRPRQSHAHQELELMLAGKKPLAVFCVDRLMTREDAFGGQPFDESVSAGTLFEETRRHDAGEEQGTLTYHFFAVPGAEWRIKAYDLLLDMLHKQGTWSSQLEWLQGKLLGYTDEEMRAHMRELYGSKERD